MYALSSDEANKNGVQAREDQEDEEEEGEKGLLIHESGVNTTECARTAGVKEEVEEWEIGGSGSGSKMGKAQGRTE